MKKLIPTLIAFYIGLAVLANWLASKYIVHVPFTDYLAPAGVFCIGAVLVIRDWLAQLIGFWKGIVIVPIAGGISYAAAEAFGWTSLEKIALASVAAFIVSELVEAALFQPIRARSLTLGVGLSATVGNAIDSWLFLTLAFGSTAFFWGNFWGKMEMIAIGVVVTFVRRKAFPVEAIA